MNVLAAEAIRAAADIMSLRTQLELLRPGASNLPLPSDNELGQSIACAAKFRKKAAAQTSDEDAINAIASFAQVVCLRPWVPEALFDNAASAFRAARPGFLEVS